MQFGLHFWQFSMLENKKIDKNSIEKEKNLRNFFVDERRKDRKIRQKLDRI